MPETGLSLEAQFAPLGFTYGPDTFGPEPELRRLDSIRPSLLDPTCAGPDPVYAIVMDAGRPEHRPALQERMLLFGVVAYAAGRLGREPVRSQGHIHKVASHSGWSAPEIFEIWQGTAIIYMQRRAADHPERCLAIEARPGERVVVPPGWAHAVISADPRQPLVFGAWCDRDYGFVYDEVRAHGGLAWFPVLSEEGHLDWLHNPNYQDCPLERRRARHYPELGLDASIPLYTHFERFPDRIQWVSKPGLLAALWPTFEP
ncbi:MAG: glucose-6-phosphate isomerase [Acidobacteria bacterium]|nr:glucose-6-phosphate isomerase [Acidobacteriota bacterium]